MDSSIGPGAAAGRRQTQTSMECETSELLFRICHDLRTNLRSIQPYAESLLKEGEGNLGAGAKTKLEFILDGARRLDSLIEALAGYAIALQFDKANFRLTPADAVLRNVLMKLEKDLRAHDTKVSYENLPRISADPDRLNQIFEVLLRNCLLRRAALDSRIQICAEPHPEGWLFTVRDNGGSLDRADLDQLFRPFQRLGSHGRTDAGLGLAACRVIVEQHGGRIWAEPGPEAGIAFSFTLPRAEE